jgi:hypothetical protein
MAIPFKRSSPLLWSEHMDGFPLDLTIFLIATFAGALVAGLSGFAFGLIAASVWLYILTPLQTATLIIAFGLIVQGYSVWKLRHGGRLRPAIRATALERIPFGGLSLSPCCRPSDGAVRETCAKAEALP